MTRLDQATEIIELAGELGVDAVMPVDGILNHCRRRVDGWVAEVGGVADIEQLESLVTQRLHLAFEEIRSDEDFDRLTEEFARGRKEKVFGGMRSKFDDADNPTYGTLVQLRNVSVDDPVRFIAVIDCRGTKLPRRFFTRWHEIAHLLTTHADLLEPVYRSEHDPIEQMMDQIAGHVGFYEPIFDPAYQQASEGTTHLKFSTVELVINSSFRAASFQATLFACSRCLTTPVIYLEAALDHKKEVKRQLATKSLFGHEPPPGELRVVMAVQNDAAKQEGFLIPKKMRVPTTSVIYRRFEADMPIECQAEEDLGWWESQGRHLDDRPVVVETRKVADRVIAIVQPIESARRKSRNSQSKSLSSE